MNEPQDADALVEDSPPIPAVAGAPPSTDQVGGPAQTAEEALTTAVDEALDDESLLASLDAMTTERDSHLADLQRMTAEFSNFRRQATKRQSDTVQHAAAELVAKLLPVLDACDAALLQGASEVEPLQTALLETLRKEGLETLTEAGDPFDPERHEAVIHEDGDGDPTVVEIMRSGYVWNGRVLRPAMVKVRG